jgi:hypothetical protein
MSAMPDDVSLPPMLRPTWREYRPVKLQNPPVPAPEWFSRDQMAEYATLAVLADREARNEL